MQRRNLIWGVLAVLLFLGALFWAREQDPFSRKWFTLKTADHGFLKCVAVLPKPVRQYPVIIYAHGFHDTLMNDGSDLRQMAEMGLAVVGLEYEQTNDTAFAPQFEALLQYVGRQKWADTNAVVWLGFSMGANRTLDFALQHPQQQPRLLVQLSGAGLPEGQTNSRLESLRCPVLFIHADHDEVFPLANTKRQAAILQTNGLPVEMKVLSNVPHGMVPEHGVVFSRHRRILPDASGRQGRLAELPFHCAVAGRSAALLAFLPAGDGLGCRMVCMVTASKGRVRREDPVEPG